MSPKLSYHVRMPLLGELENAVMEILWTHRVAMSVRDVHDLLVRQRDLAYTTVMTVLDRLSKKGIVHRELEGRAWLYQPALTRVQLVAGEIEAMLEALPDAERTAVLSALSPAGAQAQDG